MSIIYFHLRARHNGVPSAKGGYTIAVRRRAVKDSYSVSICQCNAKQTYDERLGEKVAEQRLLGGKFFVQSRAELEATLNTLHIKLTTGNPVRLDLSALN